MAIIDFTSKAKERIYRQFPPLDRNEIPHIYKIRPIEYEIDRLGEFDIIFWHRLLKEIYQHPIELECDLIIKNQNNADPTTVILRRFEENSKWDILGTTKDNISKIQSGEMKPFPLNWRYFFRLPSQGIIVIETKNNHTTLHIALISEDSRFRNEDEENAKKFILLLLAEADKCRNQLFNPQKMFNEITGVKSYLLVNVYLSNYISAHFMLKTAIPEEEKLRSEFIRLNQQRENLNQEGIERLDQYMLAQGMYLSSVIAHFYMAFEGFINILYHAFLKKSLKDSALNIEKRFDIEQKFSLLPVLCNGFQNEQYNLSSDLKSKFRQLTEYRNSIFHSKIEDSLRSLVFIEDGFLYQYFIDKDNKQMFSSLKAQLTLSDVIQVQAIVDDLIKMIVEFMTEETKHLTEKYILKSPAILFSILSDGSIAMGFGTKNNKLTESNI